MLTGMLQFSSCMLFAGIAHLLEHMAFKGTSPHEYIMLCRQRYGKHGFRLYCVLVLICFGLKVVLGLVQRTMPRKHHYWKLWMKVNIAAETS